MSDFSLWSLIVGGLVGSVATYFVRVFLLQVEEFSARFDDLCSDIGNAADLATSYWLRGPRDESLESLEAQIIGYQWKINLMLDDLSGHTWYLKDICADELDNFFEQLTGGDFEVKFREEQPQRAKAVQQAAAHFIVHLRKHRRRLLRIQFT